MYRNVVVQTVQTVLFVADLDFQTFSNKKKTQVSSKLTKKYFFFFFFPVRTRSHCDSSHVLKNVAIPRTPVLLCSAYGVLHLDMP